MAPYTTDDDRLVIMIRHSVRQGVPHFDDPLSKRKGKVGVSMAAEALLWSVIMQQSQSVRQKPYVVITSPLQRCIDTGTQLSHRLKQAGFNVSTLRIANCLAEETANILHRAPDWARQEQAEIEFLLPPQQVLMRAANSARGLGLAWQYMQTNQGNRRSHLLSVANTNSKGRCQRMLDCVDWCKQQFPGHNVVCVGHLHLIASYLYDMGIRGHKPGFASFIARLESTHNRTTHYYWSGIPRSLGAASKNTIKHSLLQPVVVMRDKK